MEHNADGAIAALDEGRPRFGKLRQRKLVGDQRADVDCAARDQLQAAPRNAARIGQRAVDVQVAAHDRAEIDTRQFAPRPGRAGQDERLQLNEDTVWAGEKRDRVNPAGRAAVQLDGTPSYVSSLSASPQLTTSWQQFSYSFLATPTNANHMRVL